MKYIITLLIGISIGYFLPVFNSLLADPSEQLAEVKTVVKDSLQPLKSPKKSPVTTNLDTLLETPETMNTTASTTQLKTNQTLASKIDKLEIENIKLHQQYQRIRNRLIAVTRQKENLDESEITDQQMMDLSADQFAQFRLQFLGKQRDDVFNFHQQEEDLSWGYQMRIQISDFIQLHYNSNLVAVEGVTCKINSCELLIIELEDNSWEVIMRDMRIQTWWSFTSTQSSSSGGEKQKLLYLYLSS